MPRQKAPAPQRLTEGQRHDQNWHLGQSDANEDAPPIINLIDDEVENYDSGEDTDFVPDFAQASSSTNKKKRTSKKTKKSVESNSELKLLLETSDFCVMVQTAKPASSSSSWPGVELGSFEFNLNKAFNRFLVTSSLIRV